MQRESFDRAVGAEHRLGAVEVTRLDVAPHQRAPQLGPLTGIERGAQLIEAAAGLVQLAFAGQDGDQRARRPRGKIAGMGRRVADLGEETCRRVPVARGAVGLRRFHPGPSRRRIAAPIGDQLQRATLGAKRVLPPRRAELVEEAAERAQGLGLVLRQGILQAGKTVGRPAPPGQQLGLEPAGGKGPVVRDDPEHLVAERLGSLRQRVQGRAMIARQAPDSGQPLSGRHDEITVRAGHLGQLGRQGLWAAESLTPDPERLEGPWPVAPCQGRRSPLAVRSLIARRGGRPPLGGGAEAVRLIRGGPGPKCHPVDARVRRHRPRARPAPGEGSRRSD